MRFDYVTFENFGPHIHLAFQPSPRLTAVVGPIGSGKSSVLAGLETLICGTSPTSGNKEEDICDRAGTKDVSRLVGHLSHGPHKIEVIRGLRKAKTELRLDGGDWIQGETKVNAELSRLIGPSYPLLSEYAFVKQGRLARFLEATPTERSAACARLFGVGRAAEIYTAIGSELVKLEVPSRSGELDILRRELGDDREAQSSLVADLSTFSDLEGYDRAADPDAILLRQAEDRERLEVRFRQLGDELKRELAHKQAKQEAIETTIAVIEVLESDLAANEAAGVAALQAIRDWNAQQRRLATRERLEQRRAAIVNPGAQPILPADYEDYDSEAPDGAQARMDEHERDLVETRKLVTQTEGLTTCPTCGTSTNSPELSLRIQGAREWLPEAAEIFCRMVAHRKLCLAYNRAANRWLKETADADLRLREIHDELVALGDEGAGFAGDLSQAKAIVKQAELRVADLTVLRTKKATLEVDISHADGLITRLRDQRAEIKTRVPAVVAPEVIEQARHRLDQVIVRLGQWGEVVGRIRAGQAAISAKTASIKRLEEEEARGVKARGMRAQLQAIRAVCNHAALPRAVSRRELRKIENGLNLMLDQFDASFRVTTGEDLSFSAKFHTGSHAGTVQPARRLSWGQKTLFAWAYRCEVNARCVGEAGLLTLDEPTDGLAKSDLSCLDVAITTLRNVAANRGLQCWLVTHEPTLGRLFDTVVTLQ